MFSLGYASLNQLAYFYNRDDTESKCKCNTEFLDGDVLKTKRISEEWNIENNKCGNKGADKRPVKVLVVALEVED